MKKKNIKISVILVAMLISIVGIIAGTNAYFSSRDDVTNAFVAGNVDIEVDETFSPPEEWNGTGYTKEVRIKNNSSVDALIRVAIVPRWVNTDGSAWAGDTSIVNLNWVNTSNSTLDEDKWIDGGDGYYYYNGIVLEGQSTVELLDKVKILENLSNRYDGKTLIVDVKAEAVQATTEAYTSTWPNIINTDIKNMLNKLCTR